MSLSDELARFDQLIAEPEYREYGELLGAPASDDDLNELEAELEDLSVPDDVIELYSWCNGAGVDAIMGYEFLSIDRMLTERSIHVGLHDAPLWLPIFMGGSGARVFVEARIPGFTRSAEIWAKGKDWGPTFTFTSLTTLFTTVNEVVDRRLVAVEHDTNRRRAMTGDSDAIERIRRRRNPAPSRAHHSFFPGIDWPASWLASLGVDRARHLATGLGVTPIAELLEAAENGEVTRTIRARSRAVPRSVSSTTDRRRRSRRRLARPGVVRATEAGKGTCDFVRREVIRPPGLHSGSLATVARFDDRRKPA